MTMKTEKAKDLLKAAKREKLFSTQARNDAASNLKAEKKAHGANKKDLGFEVATDKKFANLRAKKAAEFKRKAGK